MTNALASIKDMTPIFYKITQPKYIRVCKRGTIKRSSPILHKRQNFSLQTQVNREKNAIVSGNILAEQGTRGLAEEIQCFFNSNALETVEDHTGVYYQSESNIFDKDNTEAKDSITFVKRKCCIRFQVKNVPSRNKSSLQLNDIEMPDSRC